MRIFIVASVIIASTTLLGCESKTAPSTPAASSHTAKPAATAAAKIQVPDEHAGHNHAEGGHGQSDSDQKKHPGGDVVELGKAAIAEFSVRASRDAGAIEPGGDAHIDVWVTTAEGKPVSVSAVRFWIGTEDAKGSLKARADAEGANSPNHWHTLVEVPKPLIDGSKLWVEIETGAGKKAISFDLKP